MAVFQVRSANSIYDWERPQMVPRQAGHWVIKAPEGRKRGSALRPEGRGLVPGHPPPLGLLEGFSARLFTLANQDSAVLPAVQSRLPDLGLASGVNLARAGLAGAHGQVFVGILATTALYQAALRVARVFKKRCPPSGGVLGKSHATAPAAIIVENHDEVACIVCGEGEMSLTALLKQDPLMRLLPNLMCLTTSWNDKGPLLTQVELDAILLTFRGWRSRSAPQKFGHATSDVRSVRSLDKTFGQKVLTQDSGYPYSGWRHGLSTLAGTMFCSHTRTYH
jgi:hypothetical protein